MATSAGAISAEGRVRSMYGYVSGYSDADSIYYCPACGERIAESFADGTCRCEECGLRFGVVETDEEVED